MITENSVGAASDTKVNRPTIDWRQVHRNVRRLQMRIVKATQNCGEAASQEGRWKGLSGIWRKSYVPFLGEGATAMPPPYPTHAHDENQVRLPNAYSRTATHCDRIICRWRRNPAQSILYWGRLGNPLTFNNASLGHCFSRPTSTLIHYDPCFNPCCCYT
jgi:hypothetical protein